MPIENKGNKIKFEKAIHSLCNQTQNEKYKGKKKSLSSNNMIKEKKMVLKIYVLHSKSPTKYI